MGNHDLDFGEGVLAKFIQRLPTTSFVLSNVDALSTKAPLANCMSSTILLAGDVKVGLIGLLEEEVLATIPSMPPHLFSEPCTVASRLAAKLREDGAEVVVVLAHARRVNLQRYGEIDGVDFVFGGHEHELMLERKLIVSGSDFRHVGVVDLVVERGRVAVASARHVPVSRDLAPSISMQRVVESVIAQVNAKLSKTLGWSANAIDVLETSCRAGESNFGSFIADLCRTTLGF